MTQITFTREEIAAALEALDITAGPDAEGDIWKGAGLNTGSNYYFDVQLRDDYPVSRPSFFLGRTDFGTCFAVITETDDIGAIRLALAQHLAKRGCMDVSELIAGMVPMDGDEPTFDELLSAHHAIGVPRVDGSGIDGRIYVFDNIAVIDTPDDGE